MLIRPDIESVVEDFKLRSGPKDRYTSFDYCYNYFLETVDLKADIEKSCLVLGFYLASWGMFRGSSFLLKSSVKHFEKTIDYIASCDSDLWKIDVDSYTQQNIQKIIDVYDELKHILIKDKKTDLTLVTKTLLGVFGFVPAFDNYFTRGFRKIFDGQCGFRRVNTTSLTSLRNFYEANQKVIDRLSRQTFTTDFATEQKTHINYPKAKIIDMYGFKAGQRTG